MPTRSERLLSSNIQSHAKSLISLLDLPHLKVLLTMLLIVGAGLHTPPVRAQATEDAAAVEEDAVDQDVESDVESNDQEPVAETQTISIPPHWKRLGKPGQSEVWLDLQNKSVIVGGHVCLTRGGLEMFVCPINTKEHESVIAAHAAAFEVHAALLAVKAKPGKPVQWEPEYKPS